MITMQPMVSCMEMVMQRWSRKSLLIPKGEPVEDWSWTNIFHTTCTIGDKVCNMIIDNDSCENVMPDDLPSGLPPLPNTWHLRIIYVHHQVLFHVDDYVWDALNRDRFSVRNLESILSFKIVRLTLVRSYKRSTIVLIGCLPSHLKTSNVFNVKHLCYCFVDSTDMTMN